MYVPLAFLPPPPGPLQHEGTLMAYYHGQRLQRSREWLHARRRSMLSQILAAIAPDPKVRVPARAPSSDGGGGGGAPGRAQGCMCECVCVCV